MSGTELEQWWDVLARLRPGSRTILWHPKSLETARELAGRGFRLMLVHSQRDYLENCRHHLRAAGLASSLMGVSCVAAQDMPSLARQFYELVLFFTAPPLAPGSYRDFLAPRAVLVGPSDYFSSAWSQEFTALPSYPNGMSGFHS